MRMMTGLTPPTSGRATILGQPYRDLHNPGRQVGVMLDASAQHPGRTGREVLRVAAISIGVSKARVDEALALVGLTDEEAGRRVRNYSLGMRQRLGIAAALLGEPQVLVLDEPANGLDPQGIHWMRGLLRRFADGGGTVLLSSHLLHEVQIVADDLVMIGRGRIVAMGSKEELSAAAAPRCPPPTTRASPSCSGPPTCPSPVPVRAWSWRPSPAWSARSPPASPSSCSSCAPAARRAWRRCSSASRPPPLVKETQHEHRDPDRHRPCRRRGPASPRHAAPTALEGRPGVPFARTFQAELRKMVDTRAGRWMVIVMAAAGPPSSWPRSSSGVRPRTPRSAACCELSTLPLAMLLPVLGIMAATAEWTQRTGLVTFALEPRRGRVVLAKALAALALRRSSSSPPSRRPRWPTSSAARASGTSTPRPVAASCWPC